MNLLPPLVQGQKKDCSIVRWAEVASKGYLAVLDGGRRNVCTSLTGVRLGSRVGVPQCNSI